MALARVAGIGAVNFRRLVDAFGDAHGVFNAPYEALRDVEGIGPERAHAIKTFNAWDKVDAELERAAAARLAVTVLGDEDYPSLLAEIHDPPPVLYYKGDLKRLPRTTLAVVGTRRPTDYGTDATAFICEPLAAAGIGIVSGLARGIDSCAHRAALRAGGFTAAVLGSGADVCYPVENKRLYDEICDRGVVFSELPPGTSPAAENFPRRNRIISGLAVGVLVVEADEISGALITAGLAADQGRDVFAVPGSIFSPQSNGCRMLIQKGAKAVGNAAEIMVEYVRGNLAEPSAEPPRPLEIAALSDDAQKVLAAVTGEGSDADELAASAGWPVARVAQALLELEIAGFVEKLPGNRYRRRY